jgi:hypothetical protein
MWSITKMCPNRRLLWLDLHILAVSISIAEIIIRRVKGRVAMRFINQWK